MQSGHDISHARLNAPTLVLIAATAIVAIRCLDLLLLFNLLGMRGIVDFLHRSAQTWTLTFIFFISLALLFIEFRCAFAIVRGRNWGRWLYLCIQIAITGYLWLASLGWGYPELFSIAGDTKRDILRSFFLQKLPDALVLCLLFIPPKSRRYFRVR